MIMETDANDFILFPRDPLPILLVDDEQNILDALSRDLRKSAECICFTDAELALKELETREFSVVISDLRMPKMHGLDFLRRCCELRPTTQRILLTAFADLANVATAINQARLNLLLTKPWEAEELRRGVDECVALHRLARENHSLRQMALTDPLTQVANRRYFWERLEAELSRAKRYSRPLSLMICDIDDFKKYNDTYGHLRGDAVLKDVASSLEKGKRLTDLVARYGGEEFCVLLPEVNLRQATEIASRHLETVKLQTGISLSIGVAAYPENALSSTELIDTSDKALLVAKKTGKSRVVVSSFSAAAGEEPS